MSRFIRQALPAPSPSLIARAAEIHWPTLALAAGLFALLRLFKRYIPRVPGPAVAVVLAILLSVALDLSAAGFATIGAIPAGLPARVSPLRRRSAQLALSVAGLLVVGFSSGILTARAFGQRIGASSSPNRELAGFGAADVAAGLFQGFAVTGADSRTAVALASRGQSALVGLVAAAVIALGGDAADRPARGAARSGSGRDMMSSAVDLFDGKAFGRLARIDQHELAFALVAAGGVIWIGVLQGVSIAVAMTPVHLVRLAARPRDCTWAGTPRPASLSPSTATPPPSCRTRSSSICRGVAHLPECGIFPPAPLEALRARPDAKWLVLDTSAMMHADTGAVDTLEALKQTLDREGIGLLLGGGHGDFIEILERSGLADLIGRDRLFDTTSRRNALLAARATSANSSRKEVGAGSTSICEGKG